MTCCGLSQSVRKPIWRWIASCDYRGAAASLAAASIGTETDGSLTCPSSVNGLVGIKPTVGLVSRTHIVPISSSQDTASPMTRTVADAALLLTVMAGTDPADPATAAADSHRPDYVAALDPDALADKRIGIARFSQAFIPEPMPCSNRRWRHCAQAAPSSWRSKKARAFLTLV
jgi:Asp-tRNA(Asn)/Glu-tRNA(Gln) amidotransferase A subunit family amidase